MCQEDRFTVTRNISIYSLHVFLLHNNFFAKFAQSYSISNKTFQFLREVGNVFVASLKISWKNQLFSPFFQALEEENCSNFWLILIEKLINTVLLSLNVIKFSKKAANWIYWKICENLLKTMAKYCFKSLFFPKFSLNWRILLSFCLCNFFVRDFMKMLSFELFLKAWLVDSLSIWA